MYFKNREQAGDLLAAELAKYVNEPCAIIVLSDGGVMVAARIATKLKCVVTMLLSEPIKIPGEADAIAVVSAEGGFAYNHMYSVGHLEYLKAEYFHYIEQARIQKMDNLHRLVGRRHLIRRDLLQNHNIILVSDGLSSGFSIDAVTEYLKVLKVKRLVVATPLASVYAVDRMHILADEVHCLNVVDNYFGANHYYEDNSMPSHDNVMKTIDNLVAHWK